MFLKIMSGVAAVCLTCGTAFADRFDDYQDAREDAAEAWRDYHEEMRKGDYRDASRKWRKYQRARWEMQRNAPVYRHGYRGRYHAPVIIRQRSYAPVYRYGYRPYGYGYSTYYGGY